jgi:hypothetical protein
LLSAATSTVTLSTSRALGELEAAAAMREDSAFVAADDAVPATVNLPRSAVVAALAAAAAVGWSLAGGFEEAKSTNVFCSIGGWFQEHSPVSVFQ